MWKFVIRRLAQSVVVIIGVTLVVFILEQLTPGNVAQSVIGSRATPGQIAAFNHENYLDRSLPVQYWHFLNNLLHGNLGFSWKQNRSVGSLIATEIPRDLLLGAASTILALLAAVPIGLAQAARRNGALDYAATGVAFLLYSMPVYVPGLLGIALFAVQLQVLPAEAPQGASVGSMLAQPAGLVLPILTLTLVTYAVFSRYLRSAAIEALSQDYVRTALAKGLSQRKVLWRHVLPNSLLPLITIVGLSVPAVLTAGLVVEQLFNFPGVGLQYFLAAEANDYPVMGGITVLVGTATVAGNLLADFLYSLADPRVRLAR
jgi:peptide/nickel transport system permease protein